MAYVGSVFTAGPDLAGPSGFQPGREEPGDHCRPSTALATIQPAVSDPGRLVLAGFLAGYRGLTRDADALDLRQFTTWCRGDGGHGLPRG